ncbi:MAG: Asp-tRNA(Asn)/Glu-tRNA(Gln) amidotransferase subunit GatC [Deltaproteobacteria bacterium]|nr:MAG: Asp-tRNA(Asn)/Glu-tRNA(Gln) amidotransferase subunit GatC [Deltaproteobacteria bacterium]
MSRITRAELERIADLARLSLAEGEAEAATRQLEAILAYVEKLGQVDVDDVEPTAHAIPFRMVLRRDEPREGLPTAEALANAPRHDADTFLVPQVIEGEEG